MSKQNNFRVIINLSNFFGDHRHRARIFVSENIKTVQDLHDRICRIFEIENFYLTSQNEFLPPSEDIRVLQNDEMLWAIPTRHAVLEKSLSTQSALLNKDLNEPEKINKLNTSKKRKKARPEKEDDETEHMNGIEQIDTEPLKKKKKKKDKKSIESFDVQIHDIPLVEETGRSKGYEKNDVCESAGTSISFGGSAKEMRQTYKKNEPVPLITDQYLKDKKVNIVKIDFVTGSVDSLRENKYIENGAKESESMEVEPNDNGEQMNYEMPVNPVEEAAAIMNITEAAPRLNGESSEPPENKVKKELGSFKEDNPPEIASSGIGKMISKPLPKPKFFKSPSWRVAKCTQSNSNSFSSPLLYKHISRNMSEGNSGAEQQDTAPIDNLNNLPEEKATIANSEDVNTAQNDFLLPEPVPTLMQVNVMSPVCSSYVDLSSIGKEKSLQDSCNMSSISLNESDTDNNERNSLGISGLRRIYSDKNSVAFKRISGIGNLLESLRSANSTASSLDSTAETPDTSNFVTQRTRKRHRKRHKKVGQQPQQQPEDSTYCANEATAPPRPMNVAGTPSIHIKFDAEDGPTESAQVSEEADSQIFVESKTINDSENDEVVIGDEVILKSPLMTNLLPKIGDMIAFKILKLSSEYKPELSSYITAKVLNFNGDTKSLYFEILGGLDQCQAPEGKFSMAIDEYEEPKSKHRVYLWTDLIEPRLLYP